VQQRKGSTARGSSQWHANELLRGRADGAPLLADEPDLEEKPGNQVEEPRKVGVDAALEIRKGSRDVATLIAEAAADADADLIVVGTHGRGGFTAALMGSVARALCHTAGRPVLVVPPPNLAKKHAAPDEQPAAV
jgi:nucleotide-binding universal stress UspA family protein